MKTILKNGTYERVSNEVADYEVKVGKAKYASKMDWKKTTRSVAKPEAVSVAEQKGEQTKSEKAIKAAKFKVVVNVVKGFRASREATKVTIYKRQLIEQDFLQGWKEVSPDGIMEKTLLYRIERLIATDNKLKEIDKAREKEQLEKTGL